MIISISDLKLLWEFAIDYEHKHELNMIWFGEKYDLVYILTNGSTLIHSFYILKSHFLCGHGPTFWWSIKNLVHPVSSLGGWCVKMESKWWCPRHISSYAHTISSLRWHIKRLQDDGSYVCARGCGSLNKRFHDLHAFYASKLFNPKYNPRMKKFLKLC